MGEPNREPRPDPVVRKPGIQAGMLGALLCLAAAVLTAIGAFQDLAIVETFGGPQQQTFIITGWDARIVTDGVPESVTTGGAPRNGVPLLFAVAVLLVVAVLGRLGTVRRFGRISGLVTVVVATFLAATVVEIGVQALWWVDVVQPTPYEGVSVRVTAAFGPGLWLLVAGAGMAVAAAVVAWRRTGPDTERVEPDTPRLGIPVVRRLPDEPHQPPDAAD